MPKWFADQRSQNSKKKAEAKAEAKVHLTRLNTTKSRNPSWWIIDSGATDHFCTHKSWFMNWTPYEVEISSSNSKTMSQGKGDIKLLFGDYKLTLKDALYTLDLKANIILTERLREENQVRYTNINTHCLVDIITMKTIVQLNSSSGLPVIKANLKGKGKTVH